MERIVFGSDTETGREEREFADSPSAPVQPVRIGFALCSLRMRELSREEVKHGNEDCEGDNG